MYLHIRGIDFVSFSDFFILIFLVFWKQSEGVVRLFFPFIHLFCSFVILCIFLIFCCTIIIFVYSFCFPLNGISSLVFDLFPLINVIYVLFWITDSEYPFGIFKLLVVRALWVLAYKASLTTHLSLKFLHVYMTVSCHVFSKYGHRFYLFLRFSFYCILEMFRECSSESVVRLFFLLFIFSVLLSFYVFLILCCTGVVFVYSFCFPLNGISSLYFSIHPH